MPGRVLRTSSPFLSYSLATLLVLTALARPAGAAEGGRVEGAVLDPESRPVPQAHVVLQSAAGAVRDTRSDDLGRFMFDAVAVGPYDLLAVYDGFRAERVRVVVRQGSTTSVDVPLRLSAFTETLVVSSSLVETPLSEAPAGTVVITAADAEARQYTTVADALRLVPGMAVAANGGTGSVTSVFPRGGESDFTLVLVDGVKVNSFGGGFDFGHLTAAGLSSLEVVRGPQSAVFGADAIGGVIQVRTALGGPARAGASLEGGGYGYSRATAGTTGARGTFQWGAHAEQVRSDGWTDAAPGSTERVTNDDYDSRTAALAAAWRPSGATTLRIDARYGENDRGNPGPFGSNPIGAFAGIDTVSRGANTLALGTVSLTHARGSQTTVRLRATGMRLDSDFTSAWGASMSNTHRWSGHAQVDRSLTSWLSLSAGADTARESAESTYITDASFSQTPVVRQVSGAFGEARMRAGARLALTGGLRVEHIVRAALAADPWAYTPRPDLPRDTIVSPNPRVAASYFIRTSDESRGNWTRLHTSAGTGIRAPDAFELAFTDNPGLRPERSHAVDAGLEQSLFGGRLIVDATGFSTTFDDLIVAVGRSFATASRYRTDNIANARSRGAEFSSAWRTARGIEARVAYAFVDAEVLAVDGTSAAPSPFAVGDRLIRRPRHQVSADLLLTRNRWSGFVRASGRGRVLDVEPNYGAYGGLFDAAGFTVVDAGASVKAGRFGTMFARIDNLLDRRYERALGYPAPRRTAFVGIRVAAGR
jgi:outer membrane cobalamin receptor